MQRSTLTSRFLQGFVPDPLPPRGPNGMVPAAPPASLPTIDPPSLCEAGPCRCYHRVVSVMESQGPVGATGPAHRQITRACYPTPGIELELGETPVLQCSRWEPESEYVAARNLAREEFLRSDEGRDFLLQVASYEQSADLDDGEVTP